MRLVCHLGVSLSAHQLLYKQSPDATSSGLFSCLSHFDPFGFQVLCSDRAVRPALRGRAPQVFNNLL
jgi:hypothetical protein